jgi:hypothetical protein
MKRTDIYTLSILLYIYSNIHFEHRFGHKTYLRLKGRKYDKNMFPAERKSRGKKRNERYKDEKTLSLSLLMNRFITSFSFD